MNLVRARLLAIVVAVSVGVGGYYVASAPLVALALGVVYGVGTWLTATYSGALPDSDDWDVRKWSGLLVVVVGFAGQAVLSNTVDVPLGVGFALALVVYGAAWVGYVVAVAQFESVAGGGE